MYQSTSFIYIPLHPLPFKKNILAYDSLKYCSYVLIRESFIKISALVSIWYNKQKNHVWNYTKASFWAPAVSIARLGEKQTKVIHTHTYLLANRASKNVLAIFFPSYFTLCIP